MGKLTNEEIIKRISKKNDKVEVLDIQRITKKGKGRIMVKIKCECGIVFDRELTHLLEHQSKCVCKNCTQKITRLSRKKNYNDRYLKMITDYELTPLEEVSNLFAREFLEVEDKDGFRFFWKIGEKYKRPLVFQPNGMNYKNFKYNLLLYAKINGYTCKDITTRKNDTNIDIVCECGNTYTCFYSRFLGGRFRCRLCATNTSRYEKMFEDFLIENNIEYTKQYRIPSCKNKLPLPFDFLIIEKNILVEIQGEQHYKPIRFRCFTQEEAENQFKQQQIRDKIKVDFCKENEIPLLIISYEEMLNGNYKEKQLILYKLVPIKV